MKADRVLWAAAAYNVAFGILLPGLDRCPQATKAAPDNQQVTARILLQWRFVRNRIEAVQPIGVKPGIG